MTVTAAEFRSYYNADPKRLARLSPGARKTVEYNAQGQAPKGRISPEAIAKARGKVAAYKPGNTASVAKDKAEANAAARAKAAQAGFTGKRGPLPLAFRPKA